MSGSTLGSDSESVGNTAKSQRGTDADTARKIHGGPMNQPAPVPTMEDLLDESIRRDSAKIAEESPGVDERMRRIQRLIRENQPTMWKRLKKKGLTIHYPRVLSARISARTQEIASQGSTEAMSRAEMEVLEHLAMPEDEDW